jgi:hypothetical protein
MHGLVLTCSTVKKTGSTTALATEKRAAATMNIKELYISTIKF